MGSYRSAYYRNSVTFFTDYSRVPLVDAKPIDYDPKMGFDSPVLRSRFGSNDVKLSAFGKEHVFKF